MFVDTESAAHAMSLSLSLSFSRSPPHPHSCDRGIDSYSSGAEVRLSTPNGSFDALPGSLRVALSRETPRSELQQSHGWAGGSMFISPSLSCHTDGLIPVASFTSSPRRQFKTFLRRIAPWFASINSSNITTDEWAEILRVMLGDYARSMRDA